MSRRRQERDWPTLPIPFFGFRIIYEDLARREWDEEGKLPMFAFTNVDLILSALAHPFATAGGQELYATVPAKAAALFRGLVKNHGLRDGNKRVAVTAMSTFLLANGWLPRYSNLQLYRYALRVARQPGPYPTPLITRWVYRNAVLMSDRDLGILRRQNRRLLRDYPDLQAIWFKPELREPSE